MREQIKEITFEEITKMPDEKRLGFIMELLEQVVPLLPVALLRSLVNNGEPMIGKPHPRLPSGTAFDKRTRQARLWLDLVDGLEQLDEEYDRR